MVFPCAVQSAKGSSQIRQLARCLHRMLEFQGAHLLGKLGGITLKGDFLVASLRDGCGQGVDLCLQRPELLFGITSLRFRLGRCGLRLGMHPNIYPDLFPTIGKEQCCPKLSDLGIRLG